VNRPVAGVVPTSHRGLHEFAGVVPTSAPLQLAMGAGVTIVNRPPCSCRIYALDCALLCVPLQLQQAYRKRPPH